MILVHNKWKTYRNTTSDTKDSLTVCPYVTVHKNLMCKLNYVCISKQAVKKILKVQYSIQIICMETFLQNVTEKHGPNRK